MANGDYYSMTQDVYDIYGKANIWRWSDPDNNGDQVVVTDRINWANRMAEAYVNGRLARGRYTIPFCKPAVPMVIILAASYAGLYLYDTRRVVSADADNRVSAQKKNADMWIKQIVGGQLKLVDDCGVELTVHKAFPITSGYVDPVNQIVQVNPFISRKT